MITLYTWMTPNDRKPAIMLEELGWPYQLHPVNPGKNGQSSILPSNTGCRHTFIAQLRRRDCQTMGPLAFGQGACRRAGDRVAEARLRYHVRHSSPVLEIR
jgi:hypothetical protein